MVHTLKEENFAVQPDREVFVFRGNKLSILALNDQITLKKDCKMTLFYAFFTVYPF